MIKSSFALALLFFFISQIAAQPTISKVLFGVAYYDEYMPYNRLEKDVKMMKDAGIKVYIGGGEGGTSLERYGQPDWVTYVFTAGGTVLNALGSEPVPYVVALKMAAGK